VIKGFKLTPELKGLIADYVNVQRECLERMTSHMVERVESGEPLTTADKKALIRAFESALEKGLASDELIPRLKAALGCLR
jgi:hypothetical protein